jgi:hypothetical protein
MDRNDLTLAIAGTLVGAFLLGWTLRWLFGRINASGPRSMVRTADMAAQLHAAEDAQLRAERRLAEVEAEASRRFAELQSDLDDARAALLKSEAGSEDLRAAYRKTLTGPDLSG